MAVGPKSALFGETAHLNDFVAAKRLLPPRDQMVPSAVAASRGFIFLSTLAGELVAAPIDSLVSEAGSGSRIPAEAAAIYTKGADLPSAAIAGLVETSLGAAVLFADIPGLSAIETVSGGGPVKSDGPATAASGPIKTVSVRYSSSWGDFEEFRVVSAAGVQIFTDSGGFIDFEGRAVPSDRPPFFQGTDADFGIDCSGNSPVLRDRSGRGRVLDGFSGPGIAPVYPRTAGPWAAALVLPSAHQTLGLFIADGDLKVSEIKGARGPAITSMVHVRGGLVAFRMFAPALLVSTPSGETEEIQTIGREKFSEMAVLDATSSQGRIFVVTTRGLFSVSLADGDIDRKKPPAVEVKISE